MCVDVRVAKFNSHISSLSSSSLPIFIHAISGYQMTDADMQVYEEADIAMMREYESWPEEMKIHCEVVPFDAPPGYIVTCS